VLEVPWLFYYYKSGWLLGSYFIFRESVYLYLYKVLTILLHLNIMKTLSTIGCLLAVPLLALTGYTRDAGKGAVPAAAKHVVQVRVTGQNITGLGADLQVRTVLNWHQGYNPGHSFSQTFSTASVSETYDIGRFNDNDYVEASISFKNVTQDGAVRPAPNAFLKVEMITDGEVGEATQLDAKAKGWKVEYDPHLKATVAVETDKLQ